MALLADFTVRHLQPDDVAPMEAMVTVFGEAFNEVDTYTRARHRTGHLKRLLGDSHLIALAALKDSRTVGGLVAYELPKFLVWKGNFRVEFRNHVVPNGARRMRCGTWRSRAPDPCR